MKRISKVDLCCSYISANATVSVTGMSVRTNVDSNLFVAASTAGTTKSEDSAFGSYADQIVNATLQPSSTVDGVNFFYTNNAKADGSKESGLYTAVSNNTIGDYKAYADYVVELKAVNTGSSESIIKLSNLNLLYHNASITSEKAYRVAIFVQAESGENAYAAMGASANMIYSISGAQYFTSNSGVDSTSTVATIEHLNAAINTMTVPAGTSKYYKVTARLWLEGEDKTCNNTTFKTLTSDWKLNLGFSLLSQAVAVTNIGTVAETTYTLTQTLTGVKSNVSETTVLADSAFSAKYTALDGYNLPSTITVTANAAALTAGTDYTWNQGTGLLIINSTAVKGAIVVTVTGIANG